MTSRLNRYVLTDEIYAILKSRILNHEIASGEKINIDQLGRDLEVSNIPIREALFRLSAEGLVVNVPFKGMYVAKMSLQELYEMFEIRIELECLAIRKAVLLIPPSSLDQLKLKLQAYSNFESMTSESKFQVIAEMNQCLHGLILNYCDNDSLKNLIIKYIEIIQRYLVFNQKSLDHRLIRDEWDEHMQIVNWLATREMAESERALKMHLENSYRRTRAVFV
ncbi:GntR family transcriptional regulator [Paenibacillus sp. OV219]|uniref:GntR family transcriptional regulator n=1 Tax=Paenibacillus sp. OV219 TaxID=1884377 RepID=UPI0008D340FE|nr:GntR family transcriptional regulator [Paenibacillus sp. OV219]SEO89709.1 DNA-binding transcriptional regulator, GntR family [Paenibacillus sp. OV219]